MDNKIENTIKLIDYLVYNKMAAIGNNYGIEMMGIEFDDEIIIYFDYKHHITIEHKLIYDWNGILKNGDDFLNKDGLFPNGFKTFNNIDIDYLAYLTIEYKPFCIYTEISSTGYDIYDAHICVKRHVKLEKLGMSD